MTKICGKLTVRFEAEFRFAVSHPKEHPRIPEKVHPETGRLNGHEQIIDVVHNPVKQLVHQLRLLLLGHIDNGFEAFVGKYIGRLFAVRYNNLTNNFVKI